MYSYLASPYSSGTFRCDDKKLMIEERYRHALRATAWLMNQGLHVYSPIVHTHELAKRYDLPKDFRYWKAFNFVFLQPAKDFYILTIMGWLDSVGVQGELKRARDLEKPVYLLNYVPETMDLQIVDYSVPA